MNEKTIVNRLSRVGILGNVVLAAFKLIAGVLGRSGAMVSDAVHSLSDVFATFIAWIGVLLSKQKEDAEHPYGHERLECVASLILGLILAGTGLGIGWTGVLLLLIYYIFALIGVNLFGEAFPDWFGTIGKAMYTLFQVMTLESWSMGISRPVMAEFSYAWAYFVPFVLLSSFVVMNVVVGIVVNAIDEVNAESAAEAAKEAEASSEVSREDLLKEMHALREHLDRLEKTLEKA